MPDTLGKPKIKWAGDCRQVVRGHKDRSKGCIATGKLTLPLCRDIYMKTLITLGTAAPRWHSLHPSENSQSPLKGLRIPNFSE